MQLRATTPGIGIIAVFMPRGELKYALHEHIARRVRDMTGMTGLSKIT
jgi:hypothetical protein